MKPKSKKSKDYGKNRQRQKLVNETAEEKEIRLAKRREAYKSGLKKERKREKSILGRGVSKNAEKGDNIDCKA